MDLSPAMKLELNWWKKNLKTLSAPINPGIASVVLKTDASLSGYGAFLVHENVKFGGRWTESEGEFHINYLELLAIFYGLKACCEKFAGSQILIRTDNMTAVSCINKQGSVRTDSCNEVARTIWLWAYNRDIWLSATHIAGVENVEADEASRKFRDEIEWTLNDNDFQNICERFVTPTIDIYATRLNNKVDRFYSWFPDPLAEQIDSFTLSWTGELGYAFPPFGLVGRVLQKIFWERASVILVVPKWPTKPWFSLLKNACTIDPWKILIKNDTLFLHHRRQ